MLENLFAIFLYFSLGYLLKVFRIFDEQSSSAFINFIIYVAFPALVIYNIQHLKLELSFLGYIALGWAVIVFSIFLSFLVGKILKLNQATLASFMMMASFGNTSFLGIPFNMALLGEESVKYVIIFDQFASFLPVVLLSPFILAYGSSSEKIHIDWKKIITFPPFIALILSLMMKPFIKIPFFIMDSLHLLGLTVVPLALFSIGINLRFSHLRERIRDISFVIFLKMILVPSLVILIFYVLGIKLDLFGRVVINEIAMPPMVLASILVLGAKLDKDLAVSSVAAGIIFSFISIPIIFKIANLLF